MRSVKIIGGEKKERKHRQGQRVMYIIHAIEKRKKEKNFGGE